MKADRGSLMSGMDDRIKKKMSVHVTANSANREGIVDRLQNSAFDYFDRHAPGVTGLVRDCSITGSNASIAASGHAIASYEVAAARGRYLRSGMGVFSMCALRFSKSTFDCILNAARMRSDVSPRNASPGLPLGLLRAV